MTSDDQLTVPVILPTKPKTLKGNMPLKCCTYF